MKLVKTCLCLLMAFSMLGLGLIQSAQAQSLTIEKTWGGSSGGHGDVGWRVAVDLSGNIYVLGETGSFGAGWIDVLLLKYSPNGDLVWQKTWGGIKGDWGWGIALDPLGNIYVSGETQSFGNVYVSGEIPSLGLDSSAAYLLKYDPDGTLLWQRAWGGRENDFSLGVAVDPSGSIYVTGGTESFGAGSSDALLLKYDPDGELLWQRVWGEEGKDKCFDVAVAPSGNIYLTGYTTSFEAAGNDVLLLKYDPSGELLWQKTWGWKRNNDSGLGVDVDPLGNVFVAGTTERSGKWEALLLKYSSDGTLLWQRTWGGEYWADGGFDVAVDSSGNAYVTGRCGVDASLLKYSPNGELLWQKIWGGRRDDFGGGIAVDSSGSIYVTGGTESSSYTIQDVVETEITPAGIETTPTGIETEPDGTESMPTGIETEPDGSETHAGELDAFLLVFTLP